MNSKSLYWWCCASVPIEATVRLARKGFVPGESIPINAQVTNGSNRRINKTWAKIIMVRTADLQYVLNNIRPLNVSGNRIPQTGYPQLKPENSPIINTNKMILFPELAINKLKELVCEVREYTHTCMCKDICRTR